MKKSTRKLTLRRETFRVLAGTEFFAVAGANADTGDPIGGCVKRQLMDTGDPVGGCVGVKG